jgi:hypothetical protein
MRPDEAAAIVRNAESGALDLSSPEVLAEVERAQQAVTRDRLRGTAGRWSTRRVVVIVGAIAIVLWIVGLLVAVLLEARPA